ncbi:hypothetical protein M8J77_019958 [Diaphorina citri]|nr:hypothetical protein M8J77_019958 [Diaphorina citri]
MDDLQNHEDSAANIVTDVEMEDVSQKIPEAETTNVKEISNDTKPDVIQEVNNDPPSEIDIQKSEDKMQVLDENKLLEETKPENSLVINNKEVNDTTVEEEKVDKNIQEAVKTVVDIEDENDTLVLNSDIDSASSDQDNGDQGDDFDDEDSDDHMYDIISEGKANIYIPAGKKGVFYNPVQEFNRDLSVTVLTVFAKDHQNDPTVKKYQKKMKWATATSETEDDEEEEEEDLPPAPGRKCKNGISILDALSATGLRSMRYGLEVAGVNTVMANDMSEVAVKIIDKNVKLNNLTKIVVSRRFDAIHLMQLEKIRGRHFDAIDLDPFGNPTRFLDAAVSSLRDGGLLLVTCTDMAVLCGNTPETCYVKYNAVSLKTAACHEMALRICLHLIETVCSKYGRFIVPLLSFHADFYIRVFVKVFTSPQTCKATSTKTSMVFKCIGCNTLSFQPLGMVYQVSGQTKFNLSHGPVVNAKCAHCDGRHVMAGPIWTGPLHDAAFVTQVLKTSVDLNLKNSRRITGMLAVILEELKDVPLYYTLTNLCSVLHCEVIPMQEFRSALLNANYKVSLSHCSKNSFKTNAPMSVVWDILRCWIKLHPIAEKRLEDTTVRNLLQKEPQLEANFSFHEEAISESAGLLRYQPNPEPFWGPGRKSTTNIGDARPKSNNTHAANNKDFARSNLNDDSNDTAPAPKRFKKADPTDKSIELITLSDEEDGDSLDKEIFSLSKSDGNEAVVNSGTASLNAIQAKVLMNNGGAKTKSDKVIEEYNLCDDEDEDDLRIVNGNIKTSTKREDTKSLDDLEKELNREMDEFDKKTKSALSDDADKQSLSSPADIVYDLDDSETGADLTKTVPGDVKKDELEDEIFEVNESNEAVSIVKIDNGDIDSGKSNAGSENIEKVGSGKNTENIDLDKVDHPPDLATISKIETDETLEKEILGEDDEMREPHKVVKKDLSSLEESNVDIDKDILELESDADKGEKDEKDKINEEELLKEDVEEKGEIVHKENSDSAENGDKLTENQEESTSEKKIEEELDKELDNMCEDVSEKSKE